MSEDQVPEESDGFDEIVNQDSDDAPLTIEFSTMWEAIQQAYPHLYDGIFVRGVLVIDRVDSDGDRELSWHPSPDAASWEVKGMAQQVVDDLQAENQFIINHAMTASIMGEQDEDEGEDEQ